METRNIKIKLDSKDKAKVSSVLDQIKDSQPLSVNELLQQLKVDTFDSNVITAIYKMLTWEEDPHNQTYLDSKQHMTIGVGLDIQPPNHNDAKAVLLSVNPKWDFEDMQKHTQRPPVPLTQEEIDKTFYYTLTGATYEDVHFEGEIPALIRHLDNMSKKLGYETKLSDIPLKPHELVCLVSMAFNSPSLIGENFCKALHEYDVTKDSTQLTLQIMECSNKLYDDKKAIADCNGLQNRRAKELAIFLNDPNVHLSYRQFKRLERAYATLNIELKAVNGSPIYAQPYKEKERSSSNEETVRKIETMNDEYNAPFITYYGSKKGSEITVAEDDVHAVVICGDGGNVVTVKPNNYIESYPYLAGGIGHNQFNISSNAGNVMIWSRGRSEIKLDDNFAVQGIAVETDQENQFKLTANNRAFVLTRKEHEKEETDELHISWSDDKNDITVPNFNSGQLNLVLASPSVIPFNIQNALQPKLLSNGKLVTAHVAQGVNNELTADIINDDSKISSFIVSTAPHNAKLIALSVTALPNNQFVVIWYSKATTIIRDDSSPNSIVTEVSQLKGAVCTENGVLNTFDLTLPDGSNSCTLVTENLMDLKKTLVHGSSFIPHADVYSTGNGFAALYQIENFKSKDEVESVLLYKINETGAAYTIGTGKHNQISFVPLCTVLNNGNLMIAVSNNGVISAYTLSPNGQPISNFACPGNLRSLAISPIGKGFMFIASGMDGIHTSIFNGESWSKEVKLSTPKEEMPFIIISGALTNDYTLVAWLARTAQGGILKAVIIDPENKIAGEPSVLTTGYCLPCDISLRNGNTSLTVYSPGQQIINYELETSGLPAIQLVEHKVTKENLIAVKPSASFVTNFFGMLHNFFVSTEKKIEVSQLKTAEELANEFVIVDKASLDKEEERYNRLGFGSRQSQQ